MNGPLGRREVEEITADSTLVKPSMGSFTSRANAIHRSGNWSTIGPSPSPKDNQLRLERVLLALRRRRSALTNLFRTLFLSSLLLGAPFALASPTVVISQATK